VEYKITVDLRAAEKLIARFPEASRAARVSRVTEALLILESEIKKETPVGAGPIHLRDTVFQKVQTSGESVWGMVATPAKYGEPVEMGTKPHFPPIGPIQFWVEKKLGYDGKEARSVAFLIARAISKRGTKGHKMFGNSMEKRHADVTRILEQIPDDIIRRIQS
jgi:hypothetical protein